MIRSALIALGLSAGAVSAQSAEAPAFVFETCGGSTVLLTAEGLPDAATYAMAAQVVQARLAGGYPSKFDAIDVRNDGISLTIVCASQAQLAPLEPWLERASLAFYPFEARVETAAAPAPMPGQFILPDQGDSTLAYVMSKTAIVTHDTLAEVTAGFDYNGRPAIYVAFDPAGTASFAAFTAENVGSPFAIVLDDEVMSAPIIRDPILSGQGIITGDFSFQEATRLAAILSGGMLPFDLDVTFVETMDGSDPSADFCP